MAEAHERVGVLAALLRQLVVVGGEVGEVLGEGAARRGPRRLLQRVERDLHLGPLEEPPAAADPERHAGAAERLFEQRRLRVDAVEHGDARPARHPTRARRARPRATPRASSSSVSYAVTTGAGPSGRAARCAVRRREEPSTAPAAGDDLRGGAVVAAERTTPTSGNRSGGKCAVNRTRKVGSAPANP